MAYTYHDCGTRTCIHEKLSVQFSINCHCYLILKPCFWAFPLADPWLWSPRFHTSWHLWCSHHCTQLDFFIIIVISLPCVLHRVPCLWVWVLHRISWLNGCDYNVLFESTFPISFGELYIIIMYLFVIANAILQWCPVPIPVTADWLI